MRDENTISARQRDTNRKTKGSPSLHKIAVLLFCFSVGMLSGALILSIEQSRLPTDACAVPPSVTPAARATAMQADTATEQAPSPPVHLYFPKQGMDMAVTAVGTDAAGRMATVDAHDRAAWYRYGAIPGEAGNAIFNGHRLWKQQRGYFSILSEMQLGDPIVVQHEGGARSVFYAISIDTYSLRELPQSVMDPQGEPRVTLITCAGTFDRSLGTSTDRCIVVCRAEADISDFNPIWRYTP